MIWWVSAIAIVGILALRFFIGLIKAFEEIHQDKKRELDI
jgi:uncharacterized membrane protein SpoIIM required for sporulation